MRFARIDLFRPGSFSRSAFAATSNRHQLILISEHLNTNHKFDHEADFANIAEHSVFAIAKQAWGFFLET